MSSTAPSPSGRDAQSGDPGIPGLFCFPIHNELNIGSKRRGQRKQSFSPLKKLKVARVRKTGACLRCRILKVTCDEERPCMKCKEASAHSNRSVGLKWMDCTIISLVEWSIYHSDSPPTQSHTPQYAKTLSSILDEIQLPLELGLDLTLDFLAQDFAGWIAYSTSGLAASKLGLLCLSGFQGIAAGVLRDFSISDFRLLVWTTTLVYTARCNHHEDPRQIKALCNLKKFRNWCGENVVNALDGLCRPQSIKKLNIQQLKLLFLVVIGVCLSATYTLRSSIESPSAKAKAPDLKRRTFIRALSHLATYLGHATRLLDSTINSRALLDAADRRWDNEGSYSWLLPCSVVEKLQAELAGDLSDEGIASNPSVQLPLGPDGDAPESAIPAAAAPPGDNLGLCLNCNKEIEGEIDGEFCIWCIFMTLPEEDEIKVQFDESSASRGDVKPDDIVTNKDKEKETRRVDPPPRTTHSVYLPSPIGPIPSGSSLLWYCSMCGDGPKLLSLQPACVMCGHVFNLLDHFV